MTFGKGVVSHDVSPAYENCIDQPLRLIGTPPRLNISTKSFRNGEADATPPPPKTWLITMFGETKKNSLGFRFALETRIYKC